MPMRQEPCSTEVCSSSSTTQLAAMPFGFPAQKFSHGSAGHALANLNLKTITVLLLVTCLEVYRGKPWRPPLPAHRDSRYHSLKTTGLNRCVQARERHQTKLLGPSGGMRAMNYAERQGKELERQFGWEQRVRTFRQKIQENFIQISSDYLPSVTKYEAPANAIEKKSTKQKATSSSVQGTTGFVQQRHFILGRLGRESICSSMTNDIKYVYYSPSPHCKILLCINDMNFELTFLNIRSKKQKEICGLKQQLACQLLSA